MDDDVTPLDADIREISSAREDDPVGAQGPKERWEQLFPEFFRIYWRRIPSRPSARGRMDGRTI
jgi:hypothetical protein